MTGESSSRIPGFYDRLDEAALQSLVGQPAVRLLNLLDPALMRASRLRELAHALHPPRELLRDVQRRGIVFNALASPDAITLCHRLQIDTTAPYATLRDTRIRRNSRREKALFEFFDLPADVESTDESRIVSGTAKADYPLFPHQRQAYREILSTLNGERPRVVLHMPTGSGKTRTALHAVATELRRQEPAIIVWLAYSEELCEQAASEFATAWQSLGDRDVELHRYWGSGGDLNIEAITDGLVVAGLAKLYSRAKSDTAFISKLADRVTLVVFDEAHQALAETYQFLLTYLAPRHSSVGVLGLTATPGRTWNDPDIDAQLSDLFARQKVNISVSGFDSPLDYLIDRGYLARPVFRKVEYDRSDPFSPRELQQLERSLDVSESILTSLAEDERRNVRIIDEIENLATRHQRIIVFATTVAHARLLATVLQARGTNSDVVTGDTDSDQRQDIIAKFKENSDSPHVLCNFGVLTTGFDAPNTSAALITRPTKSLVLHSQMVGRALRGPAAGGNETAEIVTVVDTRLSGFANLTEAFFNWEDIWQ